MLVSVIRVGSIAEGLMHCRQKHCKRAQQEQQKQLCILNMILNKFGVFSYEDGAGVKEEDSNLEFSIF